MQNTVDIKDFEKKVIKTFCREYAKKGFAFTTLPEEDLRNLESIESLIRCLMEVSISNDLLLFESWIDDTFTGFEKSIEKSLLAYPPSEREQYLNNEEWCELKKWIYTVFLELHQTLLRENKDIRENNALTGDYDFLPTLYARYDKQGKIEKIYEDKHEIEEHNNAIKESIRPETYEQALNYSSKLHKNTDISNKDKHKNSIEDITDEDIQFLIEYFKVNGLERDGKYFIQGDHLEQERGIVISYKSVKGWLQEVAQEINPSRPPDKAYALYWLSEKSLTIENAAKEANTGKKSVDDKAKKRFLKKFFLQFCR